MEKKIFNEVDNTLVDGLYLFYKSDSGGGGR